MFFVDFLSREGHFRLKKQINYKKNLVWKSVLIEFVHVHVHVLYIFWNCFAFVYMYCIHKLYFNSLCICSEQHLSFHIMYFTWSAKIGQKTSWSLKSCYIRSCTRSPLTDRHTRNSKLYRNSVPTSKECVQQF